MLVGPMKRKVVTTGIVCAIIPIIILGVLGYFLFKNYNEQITTLKEQQADAQRYVLSADVIANHVITDKDLKLAQVKKVYAPEDSFVYEEHMIDGKKIVRDDKNSIIGRRLKVSALENTILTDSMFYEDDKTPTIDLRLQEFNMITLPSDLVENDYIDVRVRFPSGEDYSVLVGKRVERYSNNTIFIKLNEDEILTVGSAIIEAYLLDGAKLYANKYVDPANQLFEYQKVDYVARYEAVVEQLIAERKEELANEYAVANPNATEEEVKNATDEITVTVDDLKLNNIATRVGLTEDDITTIQTAIKNKNEEVLNGYRSRVVTVEKKIVRTYPVKENVLNIIKSNPNIVEEVKANFDADTILAQRLGMMNTDLTGVEEQDKDKIERLKANYSAEIQTQREERVAYLRTLLEQ